MTMGVLMAVRSSLAIATTLLVLTGCGARGKPAAAPSQPPDYEWSGFNGGNETPSSSAKQNEAPETKGAEEKQPEKSDVKAVAVAGEHDAKRSAHGTEAPKKISATKIGGQSVSEVSAEAVATAAQRATKRNLVSSTVIVGSEYEQVSVVLEHLAVQIVRRAATPDQTGPKVRSPKARKEDVADTNAAFYDPKADVLVLVQADKKATSARALAAIVSARDNAAPAKKPARAKQRRST
jgi:hypothetical protein